MDAGHRRPGPQPFAKPESASHGLFHGLGQLFQREGLGQEGEVLLALEILLEGILGIA